MKGFLITCVVLLAIGLGIWAYTEINTTKITLDEVSDLQHDIVVAKARLRKLNAEWAYQNRPERLQALADKYFIELELRGLTLANFTPLNDIPMAGGNPYDP
ncbi:MAG: cell division protein FtsL [Pseudomonadota bacterium]